MDRKTALLLVIALGGCTAPIARPHAGLSRQWLVGGWVLEGDSCESDAGVIYHADGRWSSFGASGTWRLEGTRMTTKIAQSDDEVGAQSPSDQTFIEKVEFLGANSFLARRADGTVRRFERCSGGPG